MHFVRLLLLLALFAPSLLCAEDASKTPPMKITVAFTGQPQNTLLHVAVAKNFFAEEGLEVQTQIHKFGKLALQAIVDHNADIATAAETPIMFHILKGEKLMVIANIEVSNINNAILARRDAGITSGNDLRGKRIGFTPGTTGDFFLSSILTAKGLKRGDIRGMELKPDEMKEALMNKKVDAVSTWNYPLTDIEQALGGNGLIIYDKEVYTETYNIVAMQDFLRQNPLAAEKFLRALIKAEDFVRENPSAAQEIMASSSKVDKGLVIKLWNSFHYHVGLDEILLFTLEDETRWAISNKLTDKSQIPDYGSYLYFDGLKAVKPSAIHVKK